MVSARRIVAALALPAAAATAVALLPTTAQAATAAGSVELCSGGSYGSVLMWPASGGATTTIVDPGKCQTFDASSGVEQVIVKVADGPSIGSFQLNGSQGVTVTTTGTASSPNFHIG